MRKYFVLMALSLFFLSLFGSNVYAQVPSDVLQAAQGSLTNFYPSIKLDSEHFNLKPDESVSLAEGYPYYKISAAALKDFESGKKINLSQIYIPSGGYIIPIKTANKQVAIAQVEYFEGKWQIVQVSNNETLESDIAFAKEKIKESLSLASIPDDIKLIYDQAFGLTALQVQSSNGEFIMSLNDNDPLSLKKGELKPLNDNLTKINDIQKERVANYNKIGGSGDVSGSSDVNSTSWWWLIPIIVLCFATGGMVLFYRKRMSH